MMTGPPGNFLAFSVIYFLGTGKTLLAKAVATVNSIFISYSFFFDNRNVVLHFSMLLQVCLQANGVGILKR